MHYYTYLILNKVILKHLKAIYQPVVCVKVCSPIIYEGHFKRNAQKAMSTGKEYMICGKVL